ncbi:ORC-CDC6 family AAA ATPase [Rhizobium leguminosarum]
MKSNPFFELYVTDRISPRDFVTIFSDFLVPHAEPLFLQGNAVVTGIQGSGKSMLLQLLQPYIRRQYFESGKDFPVSPERRKFLGVTVNLAHSSAIDFGLRRDFDAEPQEVELLFADFFNYLAIEALIKNLRYVAEGPPALAKEIGLNASHKELAELAKTLSVLPIWEDWITPSENIEDFQTAISLRLRAYRRYLHMKDRELDAGFRATRTAIGSPIVECADALQRAGFIDRNTSVFVNVDQYEELGNISSRNKDHPADYRAVINKALASRDPRVSYRIGTRGHAWKRHSLIMGTNAKLEEERDYKYVDLDMLLKRAENAGADIFSKFARDVFDRRLKFAGFSEKTVKAKDALVEVYGRSPNAADKVKKYGLRRPEKALRFEKGLKPETIEALTSLAKRDLLSAKLGEIWIRQKGDVYDLKVPDGQLPWELSKWWKKERREAAALQIASQTQQRTLWGGAEDLVGLSGGNILVFLSLNQFIWDTWLQDKGREFTSLEELPSLDIFVQTTGVHKASHFWVEKIRQETGRSGDRSRFAFIVAEFLARRLYEDLKLSNPGHTGFSVLMSDLEEFPRVKAFLEELADYGNFLMLDHTTKNSDRKGRVKLYFHPVFCPRFDIPFVRTKEPYYASIKDVLNWMHLAGSKAGLPSAELASQKELF